MVHALKPNPKNHIQEAWRIMDFFSHIPESMSMVRCNRGWGLALCDHPVSLQPSETSRIHNSLTGCEVFTWK